MFDDFGFVTLVIAIVAFLFARKARMEVKVLRAQLESMSGTVAAPVALSEAATAPPEPVKAGKAAKIAKANKIAEHAVAETPVAKTPVAAPDAPLRPGLEERLG